MKLVKVSIFGFVCALCVALITTGSAFAQEAAPVENAQFGVTVTRPASWESVEGNDRAAFNFKQYQSHSQIEVIATQLMTQDVADVFFNTFHETLQNSDFSRIGTEEGKSYGGHTGKESIYTFTHSGVTLKVAIFEFIHETTAWLVVAYMHEDVYDSFLPNYQSVISSMTFSG